VEEWLENFYRDLALLILLQSHLPPGIEIPDEEAEKISTVREAVNYIDQAAGSEN
jgi:acyl carrier protein